ncbi:hypothetical protein DMH01_15465 [Amycolatopsis sp. WAC 04182]|uniref:DUF6518 family protein n=1 Tax=Amycolatopsis sp. WAC 04182 TaxID=2203198 RepID=UPI000F768E53|nr:DUF6518 family protein [Amycolatopsis sp. WAC 04182]RSN60679.1 hypothetical protein DMH01_15465 [Amycolatopsis sp. WAC 04182]
MPSGSVERPDTIDSQTAFRPGRAELLVAGAGILSGAFASVAYYTDIRTLAHSFVIWIVLVSLVTTRRPAPQAVIRAIIALLAAVLAFYLGKKVIYGIKYPDAPSYQINLPTVAIWCVLAIIAGLVLGMGLRYIGTPNWPGALATAAAAGLILADSWRLGGSVLWERPLQLVVNVPAAAGLIALGSRSRRQLGKILALLLPLTMIGYGIVSAPDLIEDVLL